MEAALNSGKLVLGSPALSYILLFEILSERIYDLKELTQGQ